MSLSWNRKIIELRRRDVARLKFLLEGYDGLAAVTTVDADRARVSLGFCSLCRQDLEAVLGALKQEMVLIEVEESSTGVVRS
jgi:hypothetical protein